LRDFALIFGVAAVVTLVATPIVRWLALRTGAVVVPDERRVHLRPTPTIGGAAMLAGFLAAMAAAWRLDAFASVFSDTTEPLGLVIAAVVIFVVGAVDDLKEVSAPAKMAGIVLSASVLVLSGISILVFRVPFGGLLILAPDLSYLISVIWVIGMANAVNLIDGLDGLAAGIVAIASGTFFVYAVVLGREGLLLDGNPGALIAVIVLGMCIGFLPWNVHPARIFMGDAGALMLGLLMAASTMVVGGRTEQEFSGQTFFFFAPLIIPIVILGVPILDTAFAIVRRAKKGSNPATADKDHLHHRLMRIGHGHRRTVVILWAWTAVLSGFVLYPTLTGEGDAVVPVGVVALALLLFTVMHPEVRRARRDGARRERASSDGASSDGASNEGASSDGARRGEAAPTATRNLPDREPLA
jgi:UDP-GlcNAc:undecaprenyl-phosphate GlcNAc-1-phosphate transferase